MAIAQLYYSPDPFDSPIYYIIQDIGDKKAKVIYIVQIKDNLKFLIGQKNG